MANGDKILFRQGAESSVNGTAKVAGQLLYATYDNTLQTSGSPITAPEGNIYFDLSNSQRIKLANDVDKARTLFAGVTKTNDVPGAWTADIQGVTALYDGLTIKLRLNTTYNGTYNTLNVNNLGHKLVWYRHNSRLTSHVPQYSEVLLTYRTNCGTYTTTANSTGQFATGTVCTDGWILNAAYSDGNYYERYYPTYIRKYAGANDIYPYHFIAVDANGKWTPFDLTNSTNASTAREICTVPFYPQHIYYNQNNTTYSKNSAVGTAFYESVPISSTDAIIQNFGQNIPTYCRIYLQGTYNFSTGLFTLDSTKPYVFISTTTTAQDSFTNGKYYVYLGDTYSSANYMQLALVNSLYKYNGSGLIEIGADFPGYGQITIGPNSASSDAVTALSTVKILSATGMNENIAFNPVNKWIELNGTESSTEGSDIIQIGHALVLISGTAGSAYGPTTNQTPSFGSTFSVPNIEVDSAGHVTSIGQVTVKIPSHSDKAGYGKITLGANSTAVTAITSLDSALNITAKGANEKITINPGNKWIMLNGTESGTAGSDVIQIAHAVSSQAAGTFGSETNQTPAAGAAFSVPYFETDAAGHVVAASTTTVTLPADANDRDPGYGKVDIGKNSTAVTALASLSDTLSLTSKTYNEKITINPANKWIMLNGTQSNSNNGDIIQIAHVLSPQTSGTFGSDANQTPSHGGSFSVPYFSTDAAGHVVGAGTTSVTLPTDNNDRDPGYGKITTSANSTAVTALTAQSAAVTVNAKSYNETLKLTTANKWVMLQATDSSTAGSDEIKIAHAISAQTAGDFGSNEAQSPTHGGSFSVPYFSTDAAGHITSAGTQTVTLPTDNDNRDPGYGKLTIGANSTAVTGITALSQALSINAKTYNDMLTINPGNKWIMLNGTEVANAGSSSSQDTVQIAHVLSTQAAGDFGSTTAQTPAHGGTFTVPYFSTDAAGHITAAGTQTVTLPTDANNRDPGYGKITIKANSTAVTAITALSEDLALTSRTYNEKVTFQPVNKWIMLNGTQSSSNNGDIVTFGHALSAQTAGDFGSSTAQTPAHGASFNVPYFSTDAAGHITAAGTQTVTLPADNDHRDPGYGKITISANSTAVTALTAQSAAVKIEATSYNEEFKFTTANKWIMLQGTNSGTAGSDEIKIAHSISAQTAGDFGSTTQQTPSHGGTFNVPYFSTDAAGHITSAGVQTVKLPADNNNRDPGYGKLTIGANTTSTNGITALSQALSITANTYNDMLTITPGNKWIMLNGTQVSGNGSDSSQDTIQIAHATSAQSAGDFGSSTAQTPSYNSTFNVPYFSTDAAGHIVAAGNATVKIPAEHRDAGYGKITTSANSTAVTALTAQSSAVTVEAGTYNETLKLTTANKWIMLQGSNSSTAGSDEIKIAHALSLSTGSAGTAYGQGSAKTINVAEADTISVPEITVDQAGHVTSVKASTVTIQHKDTSSVSNVTASGRKYVTGLTFDTYGHVTAVTTGTETVVNTMVSQSAIQTGPWRKVLIGYDNQSTSSEAQSGTTTNVVYFDNNISANATNGTLRANIYRVKDNVELQYNATTQALDFVFI